MKKCIVHVVMIAMVLQILSPICYVHAEELEIQSASAILIEASTGAVIYEENADVQLAPASVTKVMTLLLIFEAMEAGKFTLEDEVVVSEYASSMGGSQVYLDVGEIQTVETMIKCIVVSSGNDACVAMAEYVSGTESAFVEAMNTRAQELGMTNTNFVNCNGLDADGHLTTARDISVMSQELMNNYPQITDYTLIWTDTIIHETQNGTSEFGLSNTNKLLQTYEYITGLKTGYTSTAGYCISATAQKDGIDMITVIMGATTSDERSEDATMLLNYGFSQTSKYEETTLLQFEDIAVDRGVETTVTGMCEEAFTYIDTSGSDMGAIEYEVSYYDVIEAPIEQGQIIGEVRYTIEGTYIGSVDILAMESVERITYKFLFIKVLKAYLL